MKKPNLTIIVFCNGAAYTGKLIASQNVNLEGSFLIIENRERNIEELRKEAEALEPLYKINEEQERDNHFYDAVYGKTRNKPQQYRNTGRKLK